MRYRGRVFSIEEMETIRNLIIDEGHQGRAHLSRRVCDIFNWKRPCGGLKDSICRGAMIRMDRDGIITLPPPQSKNTNRRNPVQRTELGEPSEELSCRVDALNELRVDLVDCKQERQLWSELIDRYHYLKYAQGSGAQLRYFIRSGDRILGCIGWSAAAWKTASRDLWIEWSSAQREKKLYFIVNNSRFLILPWIKVSSLASKVIAMNIRRIAKDWQHRYQYQPVLFRTPTRYTIQS